MILPHFFRPCLDLSMLIPSNSGKITLLAFCIASLASPEVTRKSEREESGRDLLFRPMEKGSFSGRLTAYFKSIDKKTQQ